MMVRWIRVLFLGGVLLALADPAAAQIVNLRPQRTTSGLHLRIGGAERDDTVLGIGWEMATPLGFFTGRYVGVFEVVTPLPRRKPVEKNHELGLLYGWQIGWGDDPEEIARGGGRLSYYVTLAAAAGVARTTFIRRGAFIREAGSYFFHYSIYEKLVEVTTGMPYEVRLMIGGDQVGISVGVFGNVNRVASYRGFFFGLFYGNRG